MSTSSAYPERMPTGVTALYRTRDLGYGERDEGEVLMPSAGPPDVWGKRPYLTPDGVVVYLFGDEITALVIGPEVPMIPLDDA